MRHRTEGFFGKIDAAGKAHVTGLFCWIDDAGPAESPLIASTKPTA